MSRRADITVAPTARTPERITGRPPRLRAAVALLAAVLLLLVAGFAAGLADSPFTGLAKADSALLRQPLLLRDGLRPVFVSESGDRSVAAPASPAKALASHPGLPQGQGLDRGPLVAVADHPLRPGSSAAFRARAPPVLA